MILSYGKLRRALSRRPSFFALLLSAALIHSYYPNWFEQSSQAASSSLVISQVYGGGGNSGATLKNDFIEIFNRGTATVDLTGWSVQYASATGSSWQVTALSGSLAPGKYYLVQEAVGAGGTVNLPTPDAMGSIAMAASVGKVALVSNATALSGNCPTGTSIIDFVGFGSTADCSEGNSPTAAPSNTNAILRNGGGCTDTDNNAADFTVGSPNPRNSSTAANSCGDATPSPTPTPSATPTPTPAQLIPIHDIQGNGNASPLAGQAVTTTGIVTAIKSNGFFIQTPDAGVDSDPNTSEGIFIFTSSTPPAAAAVENLVQVAGTVSEFIPSTDPVSPSFTEISGSPTVSLISTGNALPKAITLTAADTNPAGSIQQLERFEGMRVRVDSLTVVAPTQGNVNETNATASSNGVFYGVIAGVARPFREPGIEVPDTLPSPAPCCVPRFDANPERLRVDSNGQTGAPTLEVTAGATITNLTGPLEYAFRAYTILPDVAAPPTVAGNTNAMPVPAPATDEFTVATFNMERFYDTVNEPNTSDAVLTQTAFNNRLNKASLAVRNVMRSPDIIGVEEMENLQTLQAVADKINADAVAAGQTNPNYQAYLQEGNDVGGIDVGFLVKASRVNVTGVKQEGKDATYINPLSGAAELLNDRPPLVLAATITRQNASPLAFTVIVNHLRSLSGVDDATDGPRVRAKRRAQAEFLANLIQARQTANPMENIISVGDYNAFQINDGYVDVIGTIKGRPAPPEQVILASSDLVNPDLTDLVDTLAAEQRYSYSFDGNAQVLDHILVNSQMLTRTTRFAYARNDADFPETFRNDPARPERISDHDMGVAYFTLTETQPASLQFASADFSANENAGSAQITVTRTGNTSTAVTVDYATTDGTAQQKSDYTLVSGRLSFAPGETVKTFSVLLTDDNYVEGKESVNLSLTNPTALVNLGSPNAAALSIIDNDTAQPTFNPIDDAHFFVRQHYLDFLNREADSGGLAYWSGEITKCGTDPLCLKNRRIGVSAAFFVEAEFQQTGFFIYRLSRASFGTRPTYTEFMRDRSRLLAGTELESDKQSLTQEFVQRQPFTNKYPLSQSGADFVDALIKTVKDSSLVDLTVNRSELINEYNLGTNQTDSRARALRKLIEYAEYQQVEYNPSFVLAQYFGYLRRDPDEAGYQFWLDVLNNREPGNFKGMVCSFLTSREYQERFSPIVPHTNSECNDIR